MTGWRTPDERMDVASWSRLSDSNALRGWLGFGWISSTDTSSSASPSVGVEARSAPRPRPSPRLGTMQNLPRQLQICDRAAGFQIVEHDRLAVARGFRDPDI